MLENVLHDLRFIANMYVPTNHLKDGPNAPDVLARNYFAPLLIPGRLVSDFNAAAETSLSLPWAWQPLTDDFIPIERRETFTAEMSSVGLFGGSTLLSDRPYLAATCLMIGIGIRLLIANRNAFLHYNVDRHARSYRALEEQLAGNLSTPPTVL